MKPASIIYLQSAGGVIFKKEDSLFYVALIAIKNKTIWTLPKGLIDEGESIEESAIREVREETGLIGSIVKKIGEKSYWFYLREKNAKCRKKVTYFLIRYEGGNIDDYCWEVDEARWYEINEAIKMVSYKSDKDILKEAKRILEESF
jgi:8-oxo-dGTP diphosphatase